MLFPPAEKVSESEFANILSRLEFLFGNLPTQLPTGDGPNSHYGNFLSFGLVRLDSDILEKTGDEVATLGEQLEYIFGWKARTSGDCVIPILERGKAICALHPILKHYHEKYPQNNVLKKWVIDIATGAEKVFEKYGVTVRHIISHVIIFELLMYKKIPDFVTPARAK